VVQEFECRFREPLSVRQEYSFEVTNMASSFSYSYEDVMSAFVNWDTLGSHDWIIFSADEEARHLDVLEAMSAGRFMIVMSHTFETFNFHSQFLHVFGQGVH